MMLENKDSSPEASERIYNTMMMITSTSFVSTIFLVPLRLFFRFFLVIISLAHILTISSPSEPWKKKMNMFVTAFILKYTETYFVIVAANRVASTWLKSKRKKKRIPMSISSSSRLFLLCIYIYTF